MDEIINDQPAETALPKPWLFWSTFWLSAAVGLIGLAAQLIFGIGWGVHSAISGVKPTSDQLMGNGNFLLGCALFADPAVLGATILFVKLRKGITLADYFSLKWVGWKPVGIWALRLAAVILLMETLIMVLKIQPDAFMTTIYTSANSWMIFFTVIIGAPLIEELFFRGFMFRGLAASKVGGVGAVIITTLGWTLLHAFQYDWLGMLYITLLGIVFGFARLKTDSIWVPMILHFANNTLSTIMMHIYLKLEAAG